MPAFNKNYMSIAVSVRTRKFAARNNGIGDRQESSPQIRIYLRNVRHNFNKSFLHEKNTHHIKLSDLLDKLQNNSSISKWEGIFM